MIFLNREKEEKGATGIFFVFFLVKERGIAEGVNKIVSGKKVLETKC